MRCFFLSSFLRPLSIFLSLRTALLPPPPSGDRPSGPSICTHPHPYWASKHRQRSVDGFELAKDIRLLLDEPDGCNANESQQTMLCIPFFPQAYQSFTVLVDKFPRFILHCRFFYLHLQFMLSISFVHHPPRFAGLLKLRATHLFSFPSFSLNCTNSICASPII